MNKTKICVFAGTTEGRELIEFLSGQEQVSITACVATGYGKELLSPAENLTISSRRLDEGEMEQLIKESGFDLVIDATHPYADEATKNIVNACSAAQTEYLRLLRENGYITMDQKEGWIELTGSGREIAERIYERHQVISQWLMDLGVAEKTATADACRIEHVISPETFDRIKEHIARDKAANSH